MQMCLLFREPVVQLGAPEPLFCVIDGIRIRRLFFQRLEL